MICRSCRLLLRSQTPLNRSFAASSPRLFSVSSQRAATTEANSQSTPTASAATGSEENASATTTAAIISSVPAGTPLKGLNYIKGVADPVALEDHEYPDWLWTLLAPKKDAKSDAADEGDLFSKSKKQRRLAAKRLKKQALLNPDLLAPKIPLYEQSIDLARSDGTIQGAVQASQARGELTKAMREKRRKDIKEANFLQSMG